jgi:hypothetical protein
MLTFLFWNLGGELPDGTPDRVVIQRRVRLRSILANLTRQYQVDILILAECPLPTRTILDAINDQNPLPYASPDARSLCPRVTIYPRFPRRYLGWFGALESRHYTCRHLRLPAREPLILFAAHFGSKLFKSDDSQTSAAPLISQVIRQAEKKARHDRTLVVGDLNMNPFDPGMVTAEGLNAVMTKALVLEGDRTVDNVAYPFFYNPMWGLFGDATHELHPPGDPEHEPPGTCFYRPRESKWYYWNILDKVLLRKGLLARFRNRELRILVGDGQQSFLTAEGIPDRQGVSDHLPILFSLHL